MLQPVAPGLWHQQHRFSMLGIGTSTRMTVVRLGDGTLWVHSPVPLAPDLRAQVRTLGDVAWIVAPNRYHHRTRANGRPRFRLRRCTARPASPQGVPT